MGRAYAVPNLILGWRSTKARQKNDAWISFEYLSSTEQLRFGTAEARNMNWA